MQAAMDRVMNLGLLPTHVREKSESVQVSGCTLQATTIIMVVCTQPHICVQHMGNRLR